MLFRTAGIALCATPFAVAAAVIGGQCAADNCLRALRAPAQLEKAKVDCAGWLVSTVTPNPVTETEYSTILSTSTVVASITQDHTIEQTATVTVSETKTVTASVTATVSVRLGGNAKRSAAATIPAYASPCSGAVRFSSACSCISATPVTTTAAALTTVTTIPTTVWVTETETALTTQDVLVTVATVSTTTTVATTTATTTVATATVTPFTLTINDNYGFWYIYSVSNNEFALLTQDASKAARFELRSDGKVWVGTRFFGRYTNTGVQYSRFLPESFLTYSWVAAYQCSINSNSELNCQIPGNPANKFATQLWKEGNNWVRWSGTSVFHGTQAEISGSTSNTFTAVNLRANAV